MNWTHYTENEIKNEHSMSLAGCVINFPMHGWEAWVTLPGQPDHKVGECYKTEASARAAVIRAYRKYAPLNPPSAA